MTDLSVKYNFNKVRGDGNCLFHTILRYFGYLTWQDIPNKDLGDLNFQELHTYNEVLKNLRILSRDHIRNFIGDKTFELDPNIPEYHLICNFLANSSNMRIIVLEYNGYKNNKLNIVSQFLPDNCEISDTVILINF